MGTIHCTLMCPAHIKEMLRFQLFLLICMLGTLQNIIQRFKVDNKAGAK